MSYVVTRQMQWPDGKLIVEVSEGNLDYTNPDALVQKYNGEFEEFEDPREAAEIAIEIMKLWKEDAPNEEIFLGYGCTCGMTIPFEDCTPETLKTWAQNAYEAMPICDKCGQKIIGKEWTVIEFEDLKFCSENCAEEFFFENVMEKKMIIIKKIVLDIDREKEMAFVTGYISKNSGFIIATFWKVTGTEKKSDKKFAILRNNKQIGTAWNIDEVKETW